MCPGCTQGPWCASPDLRHLSLPDTEVSTLDIPIREETKSTPKTRKELSCAPHPEETPTLAGPPWARLQRMPRPWPPAVLRLCQPR